MKKNIEKIYKMSNYSKLPDKVIIVKCKKAIDEILEFDNPDFFGNDVVSFINDEISKEKLDRTIIDDFLIKTEKEIKRFKDELKKKEEEIKSKLAKEIRDNSDFYIKSLNEINSNRLNNGDDPEDFDEYELDNTGLIRFDEDNNPIIKKKKVKVLTESFDIVKDSFSIIREDENGNKPDISQVQYFTDELKKHNLKLYKGSYIDKVLYDEEKEYLHKNLFNGWLSWLDDYKKNIFVCFRLSTTIIDNVKYCNYESYWIVNYQSDIKTVISGIDETFILTDISSDYDSFIESFIRKDPETYILEKYVK